MCNSLPRRLRFISSRFPILAGCGHWVRRWCVAYAVLSLQAFLGTKVMWRNVCRCWTLLSVCTSKMFRLRGRIAVSFRVWRWGGQVAEGGWNPLFKSSYSALHHGARSPHGSAWDRCTWTLGHPMGCYFNDGFFGSKLHLSLLRAILLGWGDSVDDEDD